MRRKEGITPLVMYKVFLEQYCLYNPDSPYKYTYKKVKAINNKLIEIKIEQFLDKYRYNVFKDSISQMRSYFKFCLDKNRNTYFYILDKHIADWKNRTLIQPEKSFLFADNIINYLRITETDYDSYISTSKRQIPSILLHYISKKNIPFELIVYLGILDNLSNCGLDKRRITFLLSTEMADIDRYKRNVKKFGQVIEREISKIKIWDRSR